MKLDFRTIFLRGFAASFKVELSEELHKQIADVSSRPKDPKLLFEETYEVDNHWHVGRLAIEPPAKDSKLYDLFLWYRPRSRRVIRPVSSIGAVLRILSVIDNPIKFDCHATFEFSRRDRARAIVRLPLVLSESRNAPFDKIRGFHFSKQEDGQPKYDVILDSSRDGSLSLVVIYEQKRRINESLPDDLVNWAAEISGKFVSRK